MPFQANISEHVYKMSKLYEVNMKALLVTIVSFNF